MHWGLLPRLVLLHLLGTPRAEPDMPHPFHFRNRGNGGDTRPLPPHDPMVPTRPPSPSASGALKVSSIYALTLEAAAPPLRATAPRSSAAAKSVHVSRMRCIRPTSHSCSETRHLTPPLRFGSSHILRCTSFCCSRPCRASTKSRKVPENGAYRTRAVFGRRFLVDYSSESSKL